MITTRAYKYGSSSQRLKPLTSFFAQVPTTPKSPKPFKPSIRTPPNMHLATIFSRAALLATLASALPAPAPTPTQPPLTQDITKMLNELKSIALLARDDTANIPSVIIDGVAKVVEPLEEDLEDE
ncbi:hypothetical protein LTR49_020445 [Elasticomyces elasticus]|nr:hypothetical protein LTR49_020445 [Elasticomyces elasticus]KAK5760004.1 hypothetical protein LTS12_009900 [Elasticomyces elasticus]